MFEYNEFGLTGYLNPHHVLQVTVGSDGAKVRMQDRDSLEIFITLEECSALLKVIEELY